MYEQSYIDQILTLYLNGASVYEICDYLGTGDNEINHILDTFAPYL